MEPVTTWSDGKLQSRRELLVDIHSEYRTLGNRSASLRDEVDRSHVPCLLDGNIRILELMSNHATESQEYLVERIGEIEAEIDSREGYPKDSIDNLMQVPYITRGLARDLYDYGCENVESLRGIEKRDFESNVPLEGRTAAYLESSVRRYFDDPDPREQ